MRSTLSDGRFISEDQERRPSDDSPEFDCPGSSGTTCVENRRSPEPLPSFLRSAEARPFRAHAAGFRQHSKRRRSKPIAGIATAHTFASRLVMAGVDLRTVAELLGHRTLQMVMRYSHLAPEHQASAVDHLVKSENQRDTNRTPKFLARKRAKALSY